MTPYIAIYFVGVALIWMAYAYAAKREPTAHGVDILRPMGCAVGLFWPLVIGWMLLCSPYLIYLWAKGELA